MQIAASKDKIEVLLNTRPDKGKLKRFDFPSSQTPKTEPIGLAAVLRRTLGYFFVVTSYFATVIALVMTVIVAFLLVHYKAHIHHLRWRLFKLLYRYAAHSVFRENPLWECIVSIVVLTGFGCALLFAQRWAWNRRADWLRREPILPQIEAVAAPGSGLRLRWYKQKITPIGDRQRNKTIVWERFFNWQSDQDWTWGPFLPLRPARNVPMQPWVWVRLFLALSLAGSAAVVLGEIGCLWGPKLAAQQHWSVPPAVTETLGTLTAMGADPGTRVLLFGIVLSLPLLFFAACLPFHLAWNRRAARLPAARPADHSVSVAETWPPPPKIH